jgi:hypothetical protein
MAIYKLKMLVGEKRPFTAFMACYLSLLRQAFFAVPCTVYEYQISAGNSKV